MVLEFGSVVAIGLAAFVIIVLVRTVRVVPQQTALIIERLGRYSRTLEGGLHILVPFVDLAYQGFGDDLETDVAGLRALVQRVPELLVAVSCSKNFGIYRERTGIFMAIGKNAADTPLVQQNLNFLNRQNYSFPPDHGARVVTTILNDPELRADWEAELEETRNGMLGLRKMLADELRRLTNSDRFDFLADHRGMFSQLGTTPELVEKLRADHGIYMVSDSRMNIAGLNAKTVPILAKAIVAADGVAQQLDLGRGLAGNVSIERLTLRNNPLTADGVELIVRGIVESMRLVDDEQEYDAWGRRLRAPAIGAPHAQHVGVPDRAELAPEPAEFVAEPRVPLRVDGITERAKVRAEPPRRHARPPGAPTPPPGGRGSGRPWPGRGWRRPR